MVFSKEEKNFLMEKLQKEPAQLYGTYKNAEIIDEFINKFGNSKTREDISKRISSLRRLKFPEKKIISYKKNEEMPERTIINAIIKAKEIKQLLNLNDEEFREIKKIILNKV